MVKQVPDGLVLQLRLADMVERVARTVLWIALIHSCGLAVAGDRREWSIDINGLSQHSESRYVENGISRKYNETNRGLGATVEWLEWRGLRKRWEWARWIDDWGIDADVKFGFFDNSYKEISFYAGPFLHKDLAGGDWKFAPGVGLLLTTGYDETPEDAPPIFPLAVLGLELGHRAVKLNLGFVPWGEVQFATVQLQLLPAYW